jgi:hypothetical protein
MGFMRLVFASRDFPASCFFCAAQQECSLDVHEVLGLNAEYLLDRCTFSIYR